MAGMSLEKLKGRLPPTQAARLVAAFELVRRGLK
jgi:hypothetical protein